MDPAKMGSNQSNIVVNVRNILQTNTANEGISVTLETNIDRSLVNDRAGPLATPQVLSNT